MPNVSEGRKQITAVIAADAVEAIYALSEQTGRSVAVELEHAIRRHCEYPPTVRVEAEPLPEVEADPKDVPKRGRRRKKSV